MNGWFTSGPWHGHADVFIAGLGVTGVTPSTFTLSDNYLCLRGDADGFTSDGSVAGFVGNVKQAMTMPNPPMTVTPTGTGLRIDAPGASTSMLAALTDGTTSWCAPIPAANGGMISWSTFRTECWLGEQRHAA